MRTQNEKDLISLSRVLANFLHESVDHFEALDTELYGEQAKIDSVFIIELTNTLLAAQASLLDFVVRSALDDDVQEEITESDPNHGGTVH